MSTWGKIAYAARITRIDPAFFCSWTMLLATRPAGDVVLQPAVELPHSVACNFLVDRFLKTTCDSMLFVDDDQVFDHLSLNSLRSSGPDIDILGAMICCRRWPHQPIILLNDGNGKPKPILDPQGIIPVDYIGLGFTLIRREVLEAVTKANNGQTFRWTNELGEDGRFSQDARDLGFRIAINANVNVGHRITFTGKWSPEQRKTVMAFDDFGFCPEKPKEEPEAAHA